MSGWAAGGESELLPRFHEVEGVQGVEAEILKFDFAQNAHTHLCCWIDEDSSEPFY